MNCIGWAWEVFAQAHRKLGRQLSGLFGLEGLLLWIVAVGVIAGSTYVNCVHLMNTDMRIPSNHRELLLNVSLSWGNVGILF